MLIDKNPFPYLEQDQFAGRGFGEIVFLDDSIPEDKKAWLREKYKEWWDNEQEMIALEEAKTIALTAYEGIKLIKGFELKDSYVFVTDYADNNGRITPGMPMIQVFKDTGCFQIYKEYDPTKKNPYENMDKLNKAKRIEI